MGFLGGLLGTTSDYQAKEANLTSPVNQADYNGSLQHVGIGLNNQEQFVNALNGQNGIGNQSDVFRQQQALANTLGNQAQGIGPNPAMAQLNQSTGNNIANQAALMASQRGAGANAGLIARQAAMQGGALQQQAVGQSAVLQAQQQIAAQQQLGQQQAQMASLAGNQVAQQGNAAQGYTSASQGLQNSLLGGLENQNQQKLQNTLGTNQINAGVSQANAGANAGLTGGLIGGAGSVLAAGAGAAHGGYIVGPRSRAAQHLASGAMAYKSGGPVTGVAQVIGDSPKNDTVVAKLSPGEVVIPRSVMQSKDPAKGAAEFVRQVMAKKAKK